MLLVTISREGRVRELRRWMRERGRGVLRGGVVRRGLEGCEKRDGEGYEAKVWEGKEEDKGGNRREGENEMVVERKVEWQGGRVGKEWKDMRGKEG